MSLQDSIFDVEDALPNRILKEMFGEILDYFYGVEEERDRLKQENVILKAAIRIVKENELNDNSSDRNFERNIP